jgi:GGDEF domain-containing protein
MGQEPTGKGKSGAPAAENAERCLTLLVEGAALNVLDVDPGSYREFRSNVSKLAQQLPDRLPDDEKLSLIKSVVHEFENYRNTGEKVTRERTAGWRGLAAMLFRDLLVSLGVSSSSADAARLGKEIVGLGSAEEIQEWRTQAERFLRPHDKEGKPLGIASMRSADRSTANDNASGLRGGGSAVEHVKAILDRGGTGFVALFRLSCLEMISQRFGAEAVEDCLMAVSAFLTTSLHNQDAIYHWSDASLLAVLVGRPSEQILAAELQRIASHNRESTIKVAGRIIMLRIPLAFDLTPIDRLRSADDLYRLSTERKTNW